MGKDVIVTAGEDTHTDGHVVAVPDRPGRHLVRAGGYTF
jgi:hypothetical protein